MKRPSRTYWSSGGPGSSLRMGPKQILITGASGFVGRKLAQKEINEGNRVRGIHLPAESPELEFESKGVNLRDFQTIKDFIKGLGKLDEVYHLAAVSSVRSCQENPATCFEANVTGTLNLLEILADLEHKPRVLFTSSCEVYGMVPGENQPVTEDEPARPVNAYGLSKLAAEEVCSYYCRSRELEVMITRSFNHTGPGQAPGFVFPKVARELVHIEKGRKEPVLRMGNLSVQRDYLDVRDVLRAYTAVMEKGEPGKAYNVTSGHMVSIREGVGMLVEISGLRVNIVEEETLVRSYDIPELTGDAGRAGDELGWKARIPVKQTFRDLLEYWKQKEG